MENVFGLTLRVLMMFNPYFRSQLVQFLNLSGVHGLHRRSLEKATAKFQLNKHKAFPGETCLV
jgi:hypothetical protein